MQQNDSTASLSSLFSAASALNSVISNSNTNLNSVVPVAFMALNEVNTNSLQFNCITEGCQDFRSFQMREFVSQQHQHQQNQYFILIEINESTLKIKNCSNENDVRFR